MAALQKKPALEALPAAAPPAGASRGATHLVALAQDESLIEALVSVVPGESLAVVRNAAALAAHLMGGHVGVVFIDAAAADSPGATSQLAQRLHQQLPDVVLVVAGDGAELSDLTALVADGTIYRFVHKPVSAQRVKLFVDAAWRKREGSSASGAYPALAPPVPPARPAARGRRLPWPAVVAGAVTAGAAVAWLVVHSIPDPGPAQAPTPAAVPVPPPAAVPAPSAAQARLAPRHGAAAPTPVVAATVPTPSDATVIVEPRGSGAPSYTPPVSEARDPNSVAAVILHQVYAVDPVFPEMAREQDLTGFVDLEFTVRADGTVTDVNVLRAQPRGVFEQAAVDAVSKWRYRPIERDGLPVNEHARLRLNFDYK